MATVRRRDGGGATRRCNNLKQKGNNGRSDPSGGDTLFMDTLVNRFYFGKYSYTYTASDTIADEKKDVHSTFSTQAVGFCRLVRHEPPIKGICV